MRFALPLLVLAGLIALFAFGLGHDPREVPSPLIGKAAPAFALPRLGGNPPSTLANADLSGRPVLVNFFGSYCVPCRIEHPLLMTLAKQGVEIVGIDYKDVEADATAWLARHGNPYRGAAFDERGTMGLDWGVYGVPETYVLAADGTILFKQIGPMTEEVWRERIAPLLGVKS